MGPYQRIPFRKMRSSCFYTLRVFICPQPVGPVGDILETCFFPETPPRNSWQTPSMYGIFTYIWLISMVNVGKYTSPMDAMGHGKTTV